MKSWNSTHKPRLEKMPSSSSRSKKRKRQGHRARKRNLVTKQSAPVESNARFTCKKYPMTSVTAVYHSHVGAGAYLSEMDLEYAENEFFPFPESDQLVVAVLDSKVAGIGLFRRIDFNAPFLGRTIISETS